MKRNPYTRVMFMEKNDQAAFLALVWHHLDSAGSLGTCAKHLYREFFDDGKRELSRKDVDSTVMDLMEGGLF